jgi:predicted enzyme related to lactoylglutathione lyase
MILKEQRNSIQTSLDGRLRCRWGYDEKNASRTPITNYVDVKSVDEYSSKIESLGGKIIVPKTPVPGAGYFAACLDTEGNNFGIFEENTNAK